MRYIQNTNRTWGQTILDNYKFPSSFKSVDQLITRLVADKREIGKISAFRIGSLISKNQLVSYRYEFSSTTYNGLNERAFQIVINATEEEHLDFTSWLKYNQE